MQRRHHDNSHIYNPSNVIVIIPTIIYQNVLQMRALKGMEASIKSQCSTSHPKITSDGEKEKPQTFHVS